VWTPHSLCGACFLTIFEGENDLTDQENPERTAGGLVGRIAGKAKEAVGSLLGNGDLAREGRLQQAQVDAEADVQRSDAEARQRDAEAKLHAEKTETEIERQHLENEVAAQEREQQIARDRREAERTARTEARQEKTAIERQREAEESAALSAEQRADRDRVNAAEEAIRLEQRARSAETTAAIIDPEENR
jgi:uncharacterized protein YjbJ (UPF0337 family)